MNEINKVGQIIDLIKSKIVLYNELYSDNQSVSILNKVEGKGFKLLQTALLKDIAMNLASLFDPSETCNTPNLTIARLLENIEIETQKSIEKSILDSTGQQDMSVERDKLKKLKELEDLRKELIQKYNKTEIKKYRNKIGAHNDLKHVLNEKKISVDINFSKLSDLLINLSGLINKCVDLYSGCDKDQFIFRDTDMPKSAGGNQILNAIQKII